MKHSARRRFTGIKPLVCLTCALLVFSFAGQVTRVEGKQAKRKSTDDAGLSVKFSDEVLSVRAVNQPTARVLRKIARLAAVNIVVYGEPESTISVEFEKLPLDDALRRLLGAYNLVLLYNEVDDPPTGGQKARLTAAQIYVGAGGVVPTMEFAAGRVVKRRVAALKDGGKKKRRRNRNKTKERAGRNGTKADAADEDEAAVLARLKTAAFDSDPTVRADAVDELAMVDDEHAALDILERVLREDSVAEVRANAISGLEDLEQVPLEPVLDAVLFDEAPEVRIGAMEIIGEREWKDQRTVDTLSRVLDDPNEELRLAALEVLGELGERTVLENAAQSNAHQEIRELATELLTVLKP